jgi:hypothetical protein
VYGTIVEKCVRAYVAMFPLAEAWHRWSPYDVTCDISSASANSSYVLSNVFAILRSLFGVSACIMSLHLKLLNEVNRQ